MWETLPEAPGSGDAEQGKRRFHRQTMKEMDEMGKRRVPGEAVPEFLRLRPGILHAPRPPPFFLKVKSCQGRGLGAIICKFHNRTHSHESHRHLRQPE